MSHVHAILQSLVHDESGQDLIEYALVAGLIGLGAVVAMGSLSTSIANTFTSLGSTLTSSI